MHLKDTSTLPRLTTEANCGNRQMSLGHQNQPRVERSCIEAPNTNTLENESLHRHLQEQPIFKIT